MWGWMAGWMDGWMEADERVSATISVRIFSHHLMEWKRAGHAVQRIRITQYARIPSLLFSSCSVFLAGAIHVTLLCVAHQKSPWTWSKELRQQWAEEGIAG